MCSHCTEETIRKRKEFWTLLLFKASASGWICHNTAPCCGCLHVPTSSVISISSSRWMFVWCPFDAFFAIFCYTLPTPAYALNLNEVGTQLCSALKLAMMESCEVKDFTDPEKPDYIQSFMFCSNLGLINTVSSVRSKPSFEVLKLASLRSSWGVPCEKAKVLKSDSHSPTHSDASYLGQSLGSIAWRRHLHGAWTETKGQNKPQLCLVHWPSIQITRHSGQVQFRCIHISLHTTFSLA